MPRFAPPSSLTSAAISTQSNALVPRQPVRVERTEKSVGLSCLSPDGRSVHSLSVQQSGEILVDSRSLPLQGTTEENDDDRDTPAIIHTILPQTVQSSLSVDPPLELICVDGDGFTGRRKPREFGQPTPTRHELPLLCLYTQKSVFLLHMGYEASSSTSLASPLEGHVISVKEPFESYLLNASPSTCILRVRPAPQRRAGYATLCCPGSMAMLTNEYALVLCHGKQSHSRRNDDSIITTPLSFGLEELADGENIITDFVFGRSDELSLLTSMSVLLLKASGAVLGASPVLFDGTVVPRAVVKEASDYLEGELDRLNDATASKWRQCKAAQRFISDAFGHMDSSSKNGNHFVKARVQAGVEVQSSTLWPIQIQGSIVNPLDSEPDEQSYHAFGIEQFFATGLVGMAIGRMGHGVDFAVLPTTTLLPRFAYEDDHDQMTLDDSIFDSGAIVERVVVQPDEEEEPNSRGRPVLLPDPVVDTMLHYVTTKGVVTLSTNAMNVTSDRIVRSIPNDLDTPGRGFLPPSYPNSKTLMEEIRTAAWSSVQLSAAAGDISLAGVVISSDAQFGHVLVTRLSNGSMEAVDMTESRIFNESSSLIGASTEENQVAISETSVSDEALRAMEATPPLHELVAPMMKQVTDGLCRMGKIVGANTAPKDITPSGLAMVVATKERCEKEVVLPVKQLNQLTSSRIDALKEMHSIQLVQVKNLKDTVKVLKERMTATAVKLQVAESNAKILSQRSGAVLQASQNLLPTISEAEFEFFAQLKRIDAKCAAWEESLKNLKEEASTLCISIDSGGVACKIDLTTKQVEQCQALLDGQKAMMKNSGTKLSETKEKLEEIATVAGLGRATAMQRSDKQ